MSNVFLCTIFSFRDNPVMMIYRRPHIVLDRTGRVRQTKTDITSALYYDYL